MKCEEPECSNEIYILILSIGQKGSLYNSSFGLCEYHHLARKGFLSTEWKQTKYLLRPKDHIRKFDKNYTGDDKMEPPYSRYRT